MWQKIKNFVEDVWLDVKYTLVELLDLFGAIAIFILIIMAGCLVLQMLPY